MPKRGRAFLNTRLKRRRVNQEVNTIMTSLGLDSETLSVSFNGEAEYVNRNKVFTLLPGFEKLGLPKTCRTLLQTIRQNPLRLVSPGHYYHFGITESIELLLKRLNVDRVDNDIVKIQFNVDGIPIAKSSESCLWPILGLIEQTDGSVPFSVEIYHGYGKPKDPNEFLYDFVREMCLLQQTGFVYNGRKIDIEVSGFLCDAPAKAFTICIKSHTGYYSCSKCTVKGDWAGRVVFLNEERGEKRTDATFRN